MKVLIIGLGSIAKKHILALRSIDSNITIYALRSSVASISFDNVESIYSTNECPSDIDFAIISTPTYKHIESIESALIYGFPLFIEKPVYHKLDNTLKKLLAKIKKFDILTYVGCNLRHHEAVKIFKQKLDEELSLGVKVEEVNAYCGSYLPNWRENSDYQKSYSANTEMGGGVDVDLIHELDYLLWFFGWPKKVSKQANSRSHINIQSVDSAYYWLDYDSFQINLGLNYFRRLPKREVEVVLESGVLSLNLLNGTILKNNKEIFRAKENAMMDSYTTQMKYFLHTVRNKETFENNIEQGIQTLKISFANVEG